MSNVSEEMVEDMNLSFSALKSFKPGMSIVVIEGKSKSANPPWVIIGRAGAVAARFKKALKVAREDKLLNAQSVVSGRIERKGKRLVVVLADKDAASVSAVSATWPGALKKAQGDKKKIACFHKISGLLKKALVYTETGFEEVDETVLAGQAKENVAYSSEFSEEELNEIFGEDVAEVTQLTTELDEVAGQLNFGNDTITEDDTLVKKAITDVLGKLDDDIVKSVSGVMPLYMKMTVTGRASSAPFKEGETISLANAVNLAGTEYNRFLSTLQLWEDTIESITVYHEQLEEMENRAQVDWTMEDNNTYTQTFELYSAAVNLAKRQGARTKQLRDDFKSRIKQLGSTRL